MADTSENGSYWAEEYATSQLRRSSRAEVNMFLFGSISSACAKKYLIVVTCNCRQAEVKFAIE